MLLEISFEFKEDKGSDPTIGYAYFTHKGDDLKKGITKANAHFKKLRTESGWGTKAKLKKITKARNETHVNHSTVTSTRKRSSTRRSTSSRKSS
jgi:hypothetical protein